MSTLTIKTKFSIDDSVWFMKENRPTNMPVHHIEVTVTEKWNRVSYFFQGREEMTGMGVSRPIFNVDSDDVFPSKKALLQNL